LNVTIQQQRYNADMAIIRADILSKLPREEYARLHEDLKELIRVAVDRIDKREDFITGRITRLEDLNLTHANGGKTP
jgi:UDP-N-acetylmuramyl tripeptide synthase